MRAGIRKVLEICILALVASGCFPYHFTERPGVSSRLVDAETEAPIERADVRLQILQVAEEELAAWSGPDGQFIITAKQVWGIVIVPFDPIAHVWRLSIQAAGYENYEEKFVTSTMGPAMTVLDPIRLLKDKREERR